LEDVARILNRSTEYSIGGGEVDAARNTRGKELVTPFCEVNAGWESKMGSADDVDVVCGW
jgi:hypothetical protein